MGFESASAILMSHAYEAFQMEVGLFGDILAQDYIRYGCLATNGTWFANLWEYLSKYGVTLELDEQYHFKPVRVRDGSLMALFFQFPFDHRQVERFNRVRHFKGVVRVSNIISCDGP